jgi:outer membrane protein assembly factor BamB
MSLARDEEARAMRIRWVVVSLVMVVGLAGCDWPTFMHNAAHTGASRDTSIGVKDAPGLGERWTAALGTTSQANIPSSPVISSGIVYLGTQDGRLLTFDARGRVNCGGAPKTCQPLWSSPALGSFSGTPAVVDGRVFIGSTNGRLYAFDAAGVTNCGGSPKVCQPLWSSIAVGAIGSSPVVAKNKVYVGSDDHNVYAFAVAGTGCGVGGCAPLFTDVTGGVVRSSPAVAGNKLYVGSDDGKLSVFDADGSQRCNAAKVCQPLFVGPTGGTVRSSPSVADGRVFVGSSDFKLYAFDAAGATNCSGAPTATCTPLWTATTSNTVVSSPAVAKGVVYIGTVAGGSFGARLNAYDAAGNTNCSGSPKTCQPLWTSNGIGLIAPSPVSVANDVVYLNVAVGITSFVNTVFAFDATAPNALCSGTPKVCNPLWSQASSGGDPSGSAAAVSDGVVYVAGARLHAFAVNADYEFQENFATSIGAAPDLEPVGTTTCVDSFHTEKVDGVDQLVYCRAQGEGVTLYPASPTVTSTVYSMALRFRFDTVTGYRRVFDAKLGTDDAGLYVRDGKLVFFPVVEGASATIAAGDWVQVVLTRDSAKTVTGYVDGVQQFQFTDANDDAALLLDGTSQHAMRWFIDNTTGGGSGEESGGAVARIRVWNRALSATEVSNL